MKRFFRIYAADRKRRLPFLLASVCAAIGPTVSMFCIIIVIGGLTNGEFYFWYLTGFLISACVSAVGLLVSLLQSSKIIQDHFQNERLAIERSAGSVPLKTLEAIGTRKIADVIASEFTVASNGSAQIPMVGFSIVNLVLVFVLIMAIAPVVLMVFTVVFGATAIAMIYVQRRLTDAARASRLNTDTHVDVVHQLLGGAKEVRLHTGRREKLFNAFLVPSSERVRESKLVEETQSGIVVFAINLGSWLSPFFIVVLLMIYVSEYSVIIQCIYIGIYIRTYMFQLAFELPALARVGIALERIEQLKESLFDENESEIANLSGFGDFSSISLHDVNFDYGESPENDFCIQNTSFSIDRGDIIFIVGENGAGKSTLLKLMTGLYAPASGAIYIDDLPVTDENRASYRDLFSTVFTDFHLFDRTYGLENVSDDVANALLGDFEIQDSVTIKDGVFSTTKLSSGQRQRLALAVAMLEDRPVLVLDEVAADQDPSFRQRIYRELLPALRSAGRTLIVVSHDDRFFDVADRVIVIDDGRASLQDQFRAGT